MLKISPFDITNIAMPPTVSNRPFPKQKTGADIGRTKNIGNTEKFSFPYSSIHEKNAKDVAKNTKNNAFAPQTFMEKKLWSASKGFEAILVNEMLKSMRKTLEGDKLIGENTGTKIFKDFLRNERSQILSNNTNLGIAKSIYEANVKYL